LSAPGPGRRATTGGWVARVGADLPLRAATGVVLAVVALGVAWVGGFPFLVFWALAAVGVGWEWQRLIGGARVDARSALGAVALVFAALFAPVQHGGVAVVILAVGAIAAGGIAERGRRAWSAAGVVYAGALVVGVILLRASPLYGLAAVLWLFAVVWGTDVMAYFGGRLIGGPKLWPRVSPGKTWSGAIVGAVLGATFGCGIVALTAPLGVSTPPLFLLGLLVAAASQMGDLFESAMKRRAGVKDSSRLIPGHGGLMDRLDGFIVAVAVAALIAATRSTGTWIAPQLLIW
jgi:phosphatidate cytidylyltransferase